MELASSLVLSENVKQTMEIVPCKCSRVERSQYFGQFEKPPKEFNPTFRRYLAKQRDSLFNVYCGKHLDSELLSCRSADGITVVFCPSDHTGVWAGQIVQGSVGKRTQQMLEGIAKDKGLINTQGGSAKQRNGNWSRGGESSREACIGVC
jgi:hypothetical protein